mmetsp:Transcript_14633/g.27424  ORF Transcript_14633/g.27424 Transcript_14633/m.27424 type:complete len:386 (+) Transcript_14633:221-1378(+)|eukprot:CAMPEP_0178744152 /NCGR_PEP_ID=MMETSP0744-20121128/6606_1 /TAXON_ID=913974 /ORGANISM="Nitzschia punctata, Strain CCMP561" /LENGTH=385 /DNA_ID=CAMNT_0020397243 /DNA_START=72 /DNA_END=1229 /DNA_ORIENTATION=+
MSSSHSKEDSIFGVAALAARRSHQIPVSLGKASLRIRLEAYYTLIAPETIQNRSEWLRKYDQIFEKYGGTYEGERKLASKLAKKYGTAVRLLVAEASANRRDSERGVQDAVHESEEWYRLRPNEIGSGDVNTLSSNFDPLAMLNASNDTVYEANPWMKDSTMILDNLEKFATYLPEGDPLRKKRRDLLAQKRSGNDASASLMSATRKRQKSTHPFEEVAQHLNSGPISVLHKLQKKRVRIVIRYVNAIRGTLTGTLVAFDKHMNMLLRDVEETYSPRPVDDHNKDKSNLELELERRQNLHMVISSEGHSGKTRGHDYAETTEDSATWIMKKRLMKQLLVRGDMVVSVYEASKEKTTKKSRYHCRGKSMPTTLEMEKRELKVGTGK